MEDLHVVAAAVESPHGLGAVVEHLHVQAVVVEGTIAGILAAAERLMKGGSSRYRPDWPLRLNLSPGGVQMR